jgi:cell division septation protein DedD
VLAAATIRAAMPLRHRLRPLPLVVLVLLLVPAAAAHANAAYDRVATAYAESGGHLEPCAFSAAQLEAALAGIPPQIANVVPDLRAAVRNAIRAQAHGACKGKAIGSGGAGAPPAGVVTTPTTPGATTQAQTAPAPATATPAPQTQQPAAASVHHRDRTALLIAAVVLGALLLLALLLWAWARVRGWEATWAARQRHAWGEAGFRVTSTWAEFADWLRLGR